ncbi:MAG: flagellar hook-length control protein FliK [Rhodobacteraceae bacterium]|nr:flagellar hook-length control protein FliK [Paracoccaceae bacterium]
MTVLPRNPTELPAKALHSQNVMSGRFGSNHSSQFDGAAGESTPKFASLLGTQDKQSLNAQDPAQTNSVVAEVLDGTAPANPPVIDLVEGGLTDRTLTADAEHVETLDLADDGVVPPIAQPSASTARMQSLIRVPAEAVFSNGQSGGDPKVPTPQVQAASPIPADAAIQSQETPDPMRLSEPSQSRRGEIAVALNAQASRPGLRDAHAGNTPAKADKSAPAKPDMAAIRVLVDGADGEHTLPKGQISQEPAVPGSMPQARLDALVEGGQSRPAPVQADVSGLTIQPVNSAGSVQNAVPAGFQSTLDVSDDLPRLQDVKVLGSKVIEMAPSAADRPGSAATVKVIDLQLQPDTLGRIGAQLKQTGDVLEVRLEPSTAETARLLKEDRLALQRILGALGSISDPAVVRIVDPVTEQRQTDEQDALVGYESGEAEQGGDQFATARDLRGEGYRSDDIQHAHDAENQELAGRIDRRASDDIYI